MGDLKSTARSRATWELARLQHGVLTHDDLLGLGFTAKAVKHRVAIGAPAPDLYRGLRRGATRSHAPRAVDGSGPRLRGRGGAEPSERGRALGDRPRGAGTHRRDRPAAEHDPANRAQGPRTSLPRCQCCRPPLRHPGDPPGADAHRPRHRTEAHAPGAGGERGGQAGPGRPGDAARRPSTATAACPGSGRCGRCSTGTRSGSPTQTWRSSSVRWRSPRGSRCRSPNTGSSATRPTSSSPTTT